MGMGSTKGSQAPTNRIKGGLDAITAGSIYAVKVKRKKDNLSKIDSQTRNTIQDVVTHTTNNLRRKQLCRVTSPELLKARVKNGEKGKSGKEITSRVTIGNPDTYSFEMLLERYGTPSKWPKNVMAYNEKKMCMEPVDLLEKWAHRIGKNRSKAK